MHCTDPAKRFEVHILRTVLTSIYSFALLRNEPAEPFGEVSSKYGEHTDDSHVVGSKSKGTLWSSVPGIELKGDIGIALQILPK